MSRHLPGFQPQLNSQVKKILHDLTIKDQNEMQQSSNLRNENIFSLKMFNYDLEAKQKCKNQLRGQCSLSGWKTSTNKNSQFSRNEAVKCMLLSGWEMQRASLPKRSYQQPKQFHGIKHDLFSRQFPQDLSKTYSKGFNQKLKQIQLQFEKKVFEGNIKCIQDKKQKSIDAIRSRGTRFQLSKDTLFGFNHSVKSSSPKHMQFRSTVRHYYQSKSPKKTN